MTFCISLTQMPAETANPLAKTVVEKVNTTF